MQPTRRGALQVPCEEVFGGYRGAMAEPGNPDGTFGGVASRARLWASAILLLALLGALWFMLRDERGTTDGTRSQLGPSGADEPGLYGRNEQRSAPPDTADAPSVEVKEGHVVVVGRVVGEDYKPREGAKVRTRCSDRPAASTETDADGRFRLDLGLPPIGRLHANAVAQHADLVGAVSFHVDPPGPLRIDVGTIALTPGLDLPVRVVHEDKPVSGARVFAASIRTPDATRSSAWLGRPWSGWSHEAVSNVEGLAVLRDLPARAVRLLAIAEGPLRGEAQVRTDAVEPPVVVELTNARHLRVEVVRASDGTGIPGCPISAQGAHRLLEEPWARPVTGADGVAVLRHAPTEPFELLITGPDWTSAYLKMERRVPEDVTTFRTLVPDPLRILVPIEVAVGSMPVDGTRVAMQSDSWAWWPGTRTTLAREAVVREGMLEVSTYSDFASIRALARLPDGRVGHVWIKRRQPKSDDQGALPPVVFHHPRAVDVLVTERGTGKPAAGVAVTVSVPRSGGYRVGPARTDADGRVRLEGAAAKKGFVDLCSNPDWVAPFRQGVFAPNAPVDLTEGDASLELQVEPVVDAVVSLRVAGRPGLPPGLDVVLFYWSQGVGGVRPGGLRFDPVAGELRFRARRPIEEPQPPLRLMHQGPQRIHLKLTSATHATEIVTLAYDEATGRMLGEADLVPACALITRVLKPEHGRFQVQLQRQDPEGTWVKEPTPPLVRFAGETGQDRYVGLRPGRYRLLETYGKEASDPVHVRPGDEPTVLTWEPGRLLYAEGSVVLPPGVDPAGLRVYAVTEGDRREHAGIAAMDGTDFKIRVTLGRLIRLVPFHPKCKPAEDDEAYVVIAGPDKGLRLRMVLR